MQEKIRKAIENELGLITKENAPKIYDFIQSENGYKEIEDKIIVMMVQEQFTISECFIHIEESL
ncbi:hypothetical protein GOQ30_11270 [Flavobacterium sp. TP390]|uniref:Uncharacterized protein n=1 Tax=Flavobacterium profundi TaxID=1774945 RepID=A0A6I4IJE3_9FLAO|nr:hypothetical protein [Flavobacterium profundi]MVO09738.1 hypothetical protein [Flavobacterium profundi]